MMIIGMGNFENEEINNIKVNGFSHVIDPEKKNNEKYKIGMLDGLFDNFSMIIQMNEPILQDYQNILINRDTAGIINNTDFFNNLDIKLTINDNVINILADYACKNKLSISDISELIENVLLNASFEIAANPNIYSELIITSDTISDTKKYTLVKRKHKE